MKAKTSIILITTDKHVYYAKNIKTNITELSFPYSLKYNNRQILLNKNNMAMYFIKDCVNNTVYMWEKGDKTTTVGNDLSSNQDFNKIVQHFFK